jgi:cell division protein FtsI (penicillin-binding protein 3)
VAKTNMSSKRRIVSTVVVLALIVGLFVVRLVDIQVVRADTLAADSLGNRSVENTVYGSRGEILDADGVVLAGTVMRYDVQLSPKNAKEFVRIDGGEETVVTVADAAAEIGAITGQTGQQIEAIIADALADNPDSDFAYG